MGIGGVSVPVRNYNARELREEFSFSESSSNLLHGSACTSDHSDAVISQDYSPMGLALGQFEEKLDGLQEDYVSIHENLQAAISDAKIFVAHLPPDIVCSPHISVADDGEVNFFWNVNEVYVDLGFHGTKSSYYIRDSLSNIEYFEDEFDPRDGLPTEIESRLTMKVKVVGESLDSRTWRQVGGQ